MILLKQRTEPFRDPTSHSNEFVSIRVPVYIRRRPRRLSPPTLLEKSKIAGLLRATQTLRHRQRDKQRNPHKFTELRLLQPIYNAQL